MYCVKPLDAEGVVKAAKNAKGSDHSRRARSIWWTGSSMVAQVVGANCPKKVLNMALPDALRLSQVTPREVFDTMD